MIDVTARALAQMKRIMQQEGVMDHGIRICVEGESCCGYQYFMEFQKEPQTSDYILELDGIRIFIDELSLSYLQGSEIDFIESQQGAGFIFRNPNEHHDCQCGHHHSE